MLCYKQNVVEVMTQMCVLQIMCLYLAALYTSCQHPRHQSTRMYTLVWSHNIGTTFQ